MRGKGQGDFELGARGYRLVQIKENATCAYILSFRVELIGALELDDSQAGACRNAALPAVPVNSVA